MLTTKEHFKQIEMDTIQQEALFTKLTPEAAATVEGGILFRVNLDDPNSKLNIRSGPSTNSSVIGSFRNGQIFDATNIFTPTFRRLTVQAARAATGGRSSIAWVSRRFISRV